LFLSHRPAVLAALSPYTRTIDKARLFPHFDWVCSSILLFTDGNRFIFRALWQLIDTKMGKWMVYIEEHAGVNLSPSPE
jgi:hypothetical protein